MARFLELPRLGSAGSGYGKAIVWALAPFVMRHDNPAEMDTMRAASFGARPGVKPEAQTGK